jgi:uncharacterized membrane protein
MKTLRELITRIALLAPIVFLCTVWTTLPAIVPSHFGFDGTPNRFAPRSTLWLLPSIACLLYAMLFFVARHPRWFNLPVPLGDPRRPRYEALAQELLAWLRLELVCLFAYIQWQTVRISLHRAAGLSPWFGAVPIVVLMATIAIFLVSARSQTRA